MVFEGNHNLPLLHLTRCGNRLQSFQQSKLGSIGRLQEDAVRVESDDKVSFSAGSIMDSTGMTVTAVDKNIILCQGRSKTRPLRRSKSRPVEHVGDRGLSVRRASGAEACAACKAARLGRSGRRPPPRS